MEKDGVSFCGIHSRWIKCRDSKPTGMDVFIFGIIGVKVKKATSFEMRDRIVSQIPRLTSGQEGPASLPREIWIEHILPHIGTGLASRYSLSRTCKWFRGHVDVIDEWDATVQVNLRQYAAYLENPHEALMLGVLRDACCRGYSSVVAWLRQEEKVGLEREFHRLTAACYSATVGGHAELASQFYSMCKSEIDLWHLLSLAADSFDETTIRWALCEYTHRPVNVPGLEWVAAEIMTRIDRPLSRTMIAYCAHNIQRAGMYYMYNWNPLKVSTAFVDEVARIGRIDLLRVLIGRGVPVANKQWMAAAIASRELGHLEIAMATYIEAGGIDHWNVLDFLSTPNADFLYRKLDAGNYLPLKRLAPKDLAARGSFELLCWLEENVPSAVDLDAWREVALSRADIRIFERLRDRGRPISYAKFMVKSYDRGLADHWLLSEYLRTLSPKNIHIITNGKITPCSLK